MNSWDDLSPAAQKLTEEMSRRDAENAELKQTVNELKQLIQVVNQKLNGGTKWKIQNLKFN